ncbi:MAG: hypothetical protein WCG78_07800 [Candidatus Omnitrophota bacterium]
MLEIVNALSRAKLQKIDNFLTYLGIYEDRARTDALKKMLLRHRRDIKGKLCVEAGAGMGDMSRQLLALGPRHLYCVEENALCAEYLTKRFAREKNVTVVHAPIERFRPRAKIDFLFHEFYGPLLLDESLFSLERLSFTPTVVAPDEGYLLAETASIAQMKDRGIDRRILHLLDDALITDLFIGYTFRNPRRILRWKFSEKNRRAAIARLKKPGEVLILGMEIADRGVRVCGTADCENWPYLFTPVKGDAFRISFSYRGCFSDVSFRWIKA